RSGVSASVMQRKRSVQMPVSLVRSLSGLALRLPVSAAQTSHANGPRAATKTAGLTTKRRIRSLKPASGASVVAPQVHARIERCDLVAVAVEHLRLPPQELADAAFGRLAPARMVDRGVDVGVEAVLARRLILPGVERLLLDELDLGDRLDVLEA